jgi:hypothetical protein
MIIVVDKCYNHKTKFRVREFAYGFSLGEEWFFGFSGWRKNEVEGEQQEKWKRWLKKKIVENNKLVNIRDVFLRTI